MRQRNTSTKKSKSNSKSAKHHLSVLLVQDPRVSSSPRVVCPIAEQASNGVVSRMYMAKLYAPLDAPGAELLTLSCVLVSQGVELEIRYDEKFPIALRFKKQNDDEKIAHVKAEIDRFGGGAMLEKLFAVAFPKISI